MRLTLYRRPDCHLCDEMRAVVDAVARDVPFELEEVDVDGDAALAAAYGHEVPVLLVERAQGLQVSGRRPARSACSPRRASRSSAGDAGHRGRRHGRRPRPGRDRARRRARSRSTPTSTACWSATSRASRRSSSRVPTTPSTSPILHARDAIGMDEDAHEAVRARKDASLLVALRAVAERARRRDRVGGQHRRVRARRGEALRSCCRGVRRAALASVYPRMTEYPGQDPLALLLDVGATVRCEADELRAVRAHGQRLRAAHLEGAEPARRAAQHGDARTARAARRWSRRTGGCARSR